MPDDESPTTSRTRTTPTTPWVDQCQTYTSHAVAPGVPARVQRSTSANHPVSTGKLLGGLPAGQTYLNSPDGTDGIGTWAAVKKQAADVLGLQLVDKDVINIPMIAADPYGKFIPGPARGLPQYVTEGPAWSRATSPARCRCRPTSLLLRHAVPDGHRAQRGSVRAGHDNNPARRR